MNVQIQCRDIVDSTNLWAKEAAMQGAPEGTLLVADQQSAGRGRRGRSWSSPPGESIYMSLILRPVIRPEQASMLTLVMGLSVVQAVRELFGLDAWIKWPNDMVINGKKVCGILTEMSVSAEGIQHVIIGTGINVNGTVFENEIAKTATSLLLENAVFNRCNSLDENTDSVGKVKTEGSDSVNQTEKLDRKQIIDAVMDAFSRNYAKFLETGDLQKLVQEYNDILINRGKEIRVLDPAGEYNGISGGINAQGELLVTKEDGTCVSVYAGEVSVRGVYGYV